MDSIDLQDARTHNGLDASAVTPSATNYGGEALPQAGDREYRRQRKVCPANQTTLTVIGPAALDPAGVVSIAE